MLGGPYSDLTPDAFTKNNLISLAPSFKTNDTAVAVIGAGGIDYVWKSYVSFRVTGAYIRSYMFKETQNNVRISGGVASESETSELTVSTVAESVE